MENLKRGFLRAIKRLFPLIVIALIWLQSCAYFNTYYNAQKLFNQAEEARMKAEKNAARGASSRDYVDLYDKAIKKAAKVLAFFPNSRWVDDSVMLMGKAFYWQGEFSKAEVKFSELLSNFPKSKFVKEALYWHGLTLWKIGRFPEAVETLRQASEEKDNPWADSALLTLGDISFESRNFDDAIDNYQRLISRFPKSKRKVEALQMIGKSYLAQQEYDQAIKIFREILNQKLDTELAYYANLQIGESLQAQGQLNEALQLYQTVAKNMKFYSHFSEIRLRIASCYDKLGKSQTAFKEYESITNDYPKTAASAEAFYRMGLIKEVVSGNLKEAEELFNKVKEEGGNRQIADSARVRKADVTQLRIYQSLVDSVSRDSTLSDSTRVKLSKTWFLMAELYLLKIGLPDSALLSYRRSIEIFPKSENAPKALYSIGWIKEYVKTDSAGALQFYRELIEKYPKSQHAQAVRAKLGMTGGQEMEDDPAKKDFLVIESERFSNEKPEIYISHLKELIEKYPKSDYAAKAAYLVAWSYENVQKDSLRAIESYRNVIQRFPDSEYAKVAQKKLQLVETQTTKEKQNDQVHAPDQTSPPGGPRKAQPQAQSTEKEEKGEKVPEKLIPPD